MSTIYPVILFCCAGYFNAIISMDTYDASCPPCKKARAEHRNLMQQQDQGVLTPRKAAKIAWSAAYNGDYLMAKEYLHKAARLGDIFSCAYLAHGHQQGNLITNVDQRQAEQFEKLLAHRLKENEDSSHIPVYYWRFDQKIQRKNEYLLGHDFARKNAWYQSLENLFKKARDSRPSRKRSRHFHFIPPAQGLDQLISLYAHGKMDMKEEEVPLLVQALKEFNDPRPYDKILALLNDDHNTTEGSKYFFLLTLIHDWAIAHNRHKELEKIYSRDINGALSGLQRHPNAKELNEPTFGKVLEMLPMFYQIDHASALSSLGHIIEEHVRQLARGLLWPAATLVRFLTYAQQLNPALFEHHCATMLSENLEGLMRCVCKQQSIMHAFEGSTFSIDNIIEKAFEQALKNEVDAAAFGEFLSEGMAFHEKYQDRIVAILPLYFKLHWYAQWKLIALLESPIKKLRTAAFQALTEHITAPNSEKLGYGVKSCFENVFACSLCEIIGNGSALDAYKYFYQACIKNGCLLSLQLLWHHLSTNNEEEIKNFVQSMIKEFFNLPTAQSIADSFDSLLNNAISTALQEKNIPQCQLRAFLIHANSTGLSEKIRPAFLEEYKSFCLLQEETPIKERCQFLEDLITMCIKKGKSYDHIAVKIGSTAGTIFREYAKTVIATLNPEQTFYEYFSNRKKLKVLCIKIGNLDPDIIRSINPGYYNAFRDTYWDKSDACSEACNVHITIAHSLRHAVLDCDKIFGYVVNDTGYPTFPCYYRFYACNSTDGYALWASPLKLKKEHPFVVHGDVVYCVSDTNDIVMFNKIDGSIIRSIKLPVGRAIEAMNVTADKSLCALCKDKLCIVNLETNTWRTWQVPSYVYTTITADSYYIIDDKIVFVSNNKEQRKSSIEIFDKNGGDRIFESELVDLFWNTRHPLQSNHQMVWYITAHNNKIIFLDIATGEKRWEYQLSAELQAAKKSHNGDRLFLLTKNELIALDIRPTRANQPNELWKTSVHNAQRSDNPEEITDIVVSDDGSTVYGIHKYRGGALFHFDSQTGVKFYLYDIDGPAHTMLGTHNGKLYVQPISH